VVLLFCQRTFAVIFEIYFFREKTGVNRTSLSKMQNPANRHSTTTAAVDALCNYFGCSVGELMVHVPEPQDPA